MCYKQQLKLCCQNPKINLNFWYGQTLFLIIRVRAYCYGYQVLLIIIFWQSVRLQVGPESFLPDLYAKLILLENFSQNTWPLLSTNPVHINPGGHTFLQCPTLASFLGVAQGSHMPWVLHQPMLMSLPPVCAVPMEPSTVLLLGVGGLCFSSLGWERRDCVVYGPHWELLFGLAPCKMKIIASHTSLPLAHLPRLPWKWTCCFWSTHVL